MKIKHIYIIIIVAALFYSCSNTKHLPEGEMLYTGADVTVEDTLMSRRDRKDMEAEMEDLTRPKPNRKFLGMRIKLYLYNLAGEPKKDKGFRYWLRNKAGEPPVLFSQVDLDYNADVLQSNAENDGYFKARTSADSTSHNKKARAEYTIMPKQQYKIRKVTFPEDSSMVQIDSAVAKLKRRSRLRLGRAYNLDVIKDERNRIDERLKEKGYFYFSPDYILVKVDSTVGDHQVDMKVLVKKETPEKAKRVYKINNIYIYPNYSLNDSRDTLRAANNISKDSVQQYKDFTIIDTKQTFRPIIYDRTLYFHKGDIYNRTDHNLSLNRLINLGTFRFVKNEFRVSDSLNTMLDTYYYLTPLPKKSIRVELLAKTNSANYNGSEINVNWSNRNTFKAAELLTISTFGGLEVQMAGQNKGYNVYRVGSEVSLVWPRFITPFKVETPSAFVPRTRAMVSYEFQKRIRLYALNSFRAQFGYLWKEDIKKEHELNVFDVSYVSPNGVTDEYRQRINDDASLSKVIEKQFIFGPTYSYTYTNTMRKYKKHTIYYKASVEAAGTIAGLATGANVKKGDTVSVLNVPFSQFVKTEQDFRYYLRLGRNSKLASRAIVGIGMPYGNSSELPYIRQFFSGGTNSIRAFRARAIGPGSYYPENVDPNSFLPDQSGDIKLELNLEYRAKLYSIIHGAAFIDAGNIWLWNKNDNKEGAQFSSDFLKELAVGTGVGIRLDLSFLVLRLDTAFPIRKPHLPESNRWVLDQIDFGSKTWRKENLVFNLAIGYPF